MNRAARDSSSSSRAPLSQRNVNIENQNHGVFAGASSKSSTVLLPPKNDVALITTSTRSNSLLQRQQSAATTASVTGSETMSSIGGGEANRAFSSLSSETLRNVIESGTTKLPPITKKKPFASSSIHQQPNIIRSSDAPLERKAANSATTVVSKSPSSSEQVTIVEHRKRPCGDGFTVHTYLRGKLLGKGGFAKVYKVTSLDTNKEYAIKIVPKANLVKSRARQKVRCLFLMCPLILFMRCCATLSSKTTNPTSSTIGLATVAN